MRHGVDGRKFGRNTSHRKALFRNMANSLIVQEQITTTLPKAKEARRVVDRLITFAKSGKSHARRLVFDRTRDVQVVEKLFTTLADRYRTRPGGYTRILKLSQRRRGDAAEVAVLELVDHSLVNRKRKKPTTDQKKEDQGTSKDKKLATEKEEHEKKGVDTFSKFRKLFSTKKKESSVGKSRGSSRGK